MRVLCARGGEQPGGDRSACGGNAVAGQRGAGWRVVCAQRAVSFPLWPQSDDRGGARPDHAPQFAHRLKPMMNRASSRRQQQGGGTLALSLIVLTLLALMAAQTLRRV